MKFFRAYVADGLKVPTFFIESTARDNVDDSAGNRPPLPPQLKRIEDSDVAVQEIAQILARGSNPNLVVMVHGFNNPEPDVLRTYTAAAMAVHRDHRIRGGDGLVCVGYRWPSEKIGVPWHGSWAAMPTLADWILRAGTVFAILPFLLSYVLLDFLQWSPRAVWPIQLAAHVLTMIGLTCAGLVFTAAILRAIVYFRDNYRATNYGVPDLVQVIRAIDGELGKLRGSDPKNDIQLSFIGHSMGGFVVTNTLRVLSDVFSRPVSALNSYGADPAPQDQDDPRARFIGNAFTLKRFVLASPDIPAETLLSNRGNFLASMLSRFEEAFLFSSEGDEVLRQISTLANYFVFPTRNRRHGFRLGNVEILSSGFGLIEPGADFLEMLRVGDLTVRELNDVLERARAKDQDNAPKDPKAPPRPPLPTIFSYFDCTDYVDRDDSGGGPRPILTFAKCTKRSNRKARLRWYSHLRLLLAYLGPGHRPNVHGGYFEGLLSQELIYRLACLGYQGTTAAYGSLDKLAKACEEKQIRVLISPRLSTIPSPGLSSAPATAPAVADTHAPTHLPPAAESV